MKAIILAGGLGTRLKKIIGNDIPKAMALIGGEPFLAHQLRMLKFQNINKVVISVGHLANVIQDYFGDEFEGIKIRYAFEDMPLGTGGALKFAIKTLKAGTPILVMNGDTIASFNSQNMLKQYIPPITIASTDGISAGIYIVSPDFLKEETRTSFSLEADIIPKIRAVPYYEIPWFIDIGTPEGYERARAKFLCQ